ncbi:MAG: DUF374 domain-containing protein [Planctomycetota bacterium]|nr:MAG: DUF374 domain-containing protein [Planctomycetota bacterium]
MLAMSSSGPAARKPKTSLRRRYKRLRRRAGSWLVPWLAPATLGVLARSWRFTVLDAERERACVDAPGRLYALWHGRMLLGLEHHRDRSHAVLVSHSDDGALVKPLLLKFGFQVIRGSSSRGGARALREMLGELREGGTVVVTPDGPRGPRHAVNPGLAWMARATGFPILPIGFATDSAWRLSSWDAFTIPRPRARVAMAYGEPIRVPRSASEADLVAATEQLRVRLLAAEVRAARELGVPLDWPESERVAWEAETRDGRARA